MKNHLFLGTVAVGLIGLAVFSFVGRSVEAEPQRTLPLGLLLDESGGRLTVQRTSQAASDYGFRVGDVISTVQGISVGSVADLRQSLLHTDSGDTLEISVQRGTSQLTINRPFRGALEFPSPDGTLYAKRTVIAKPTPLTADRSPSNLASVEEPATGTHLVNRMWADFGMHFEQTDVGLRVISIVPNGVAEAHGIEIGDVLFQVDDARIGSLNDFNAIAVERFRGDVVSLILMRGDTLLAIQEMRLPTTGDAVPQPPVGSVQRCELTKLICSDGTLAVNVPFESHLYDLASSIHSVSVKETPAGNVVEPQPVVLSKNLSQLPIPVVAAQAEAATLPDPPFFNLFSKDAITEEDGSVGSIGAVDSIRTGIPRKVTIADVPTSTDAHVEHDGENTFVQSKPELPAVIDLFATKDEELRLPTPSDNVGAGVHALPIPKIFTQRKNTQTGIHAITKPVALTPRMSSEKLTQTPRVASSVSIPSGVESTLATSPLSRSEQVQPKLTKVSRQRQLLLNLFVDANREPATSEHSVPPAPTVKYDRTESLMNVDDATKHLQVTDSDDAWTESPERRQKLRSLITGINPVMVPGTGPVDADELVRKHEQESPTIPVSIYDPDDHGEAAVGGGMASSESDLDVEIPKTYDPYPRVSTTELVCATSGADLVFGDWSGCCSFPLATRLANVSSLSLNEALYGNCEPTVSIGGWTSIGFHTENNGLFNDRRRDLHLNQAWLFFEKEANDCNRLGFRADVIYGIDGADTQAFGNNVGRWDFDNGFDHGPYSWALPQAYVEAAWKDWRIKMGHFFTIAGYESVMAPDNFFYSHAMTMYNSEPFTHTGVLVSKLVSDQTTIFAGWSLGWDTGFDQFGQGNAWLGGFEHAFTDCFSVAYVSTAGDFGARGSEASSYSIVADLAVTNELNWIVQGDCLRVGSTGEDNVGVNQYFVYTINPCWGVGARMEWWKGDVLTGYVPHGGTLPATGSLSYYAATFGVNYRPRDFLVLRPEVRHDWSPAANYEQTYFAMDAIIRF